MYNSILVIGIGRSVDKSVLLVKKWQHFSSVRDEKSKKQSLKSDTKSVEISL